MKIYSVLLVTLVILLGSTVAMAQDDTTQTPDPVAADTTATADTTAAAEPALTEEAEPKDEPNGGPTWGIKGWVGAGLPSHTNLPDGATTIADIAYAGGIFFNWSGRGLISFAVQPELMYVSEVGVTGDLPEAHPEVTTTVNSLRLPVLIKLQFLDPLIVQPSIYAGPSFSYVVSASNAHGETTRDLSDGALQVGLAAGVDVTILSFLIVDVRFNTNFTELTYDVSETIQDISLTMSSLKVGLGLRF